MPLFRWGRNLDAFQDLEREVDRLLQSVNLTVHGLRSGRQYPPVNIYEMPDEYLLTARLAATRPEDLELTITGGVLTVAGRRSDNDESPPDRFRRQERPSGGWQRSVTIPDRIQEDALSAEFTNGVLTVHLPKAARGEPRQIPVSGEGD